MAKKDEQPPATTGFEQAPIVPNKKRYSPAMEAIHKIERILGKLNAAEQVQVYLHLRSQFQPELSFAPKPT